MLEEEKGHLSQKDVDAIGKSLDTVLKILDSVHTSIEKRVLSLESSLIKIKDWQNDVKANLKSLMSSNTKDLISSEFNSRLMEIDAKMLDLVKSTEYIINEFNSSPLDKIEVELEHCKKKLEQMDKFQYSISNHLTPAEFRRLKEIIIAMDINDAERKNLERSNKRKTQLITALIGFATGICGTAISVFLKFYLEH